LGRARVAVPEVMVSETVVTVVSSTAVAEEDRVQVVAAEAAFVNTVVLASVSVSVNVVPDNVPVRVRVSAPVCGAQLPSEFSVNAIAPPSPLSSSTEVPEVLRICV
jgi:hypothetical protein